MGPGKDDQHEDPQQTLPPHQQGQSRRLVTEPEDDLGTGQHRGRRLRLGTPTRVAPTIASPQAPESSPALQRGFTIGSPLHVSGTDQTIAGKPSVQPWILYVAAGATVLLLMALVLRPSEGGNVEATANARLLSQYTQYLETKGQAKQIDLNVRKKEVVERLQAVAWAKAIGDSAALEAELRGLLFMDQDKNSPLYQYSVSELKRLPAKKTGL